MNTPVEAVELENPVMIERYEFIADSGGPGKYRGVYGPPVQRDPEAVQWDLINEKISGESAQKNYKVVFNQGMKVDVQATKSLRARHNTEMDK